MNHSKDNFFILFVQKITFQIRIIVQVSCTYFAQKVVDAMLRPDTNQAPQLMSIADDELTKRATPLVVAASLSQHDVSHGRGLSAATKVNKCQKVNKVTWQGSILKDFFWGS